MSRRSAEHARLARRQRVADFYTRGYSQRDIARRVGTSQSTVGRDLQWIWKQWIASALVDFDAAKARELARVDALERESWHAWRRSKRKIEETTQETVRGVGPDADRTRDRVQVKERRQVGDPRYLDRVAWCIEQRCKILGLHEAAKMDLRHSWQENVPAEEKELADAFFEDLAAQLAARQEEDG